MLTDWMRNQLIAAAGTYLNDTCTISRETPTTGEYGETVMGSQVVAADVPCRVIGLGRRNNSGVEQAASKESMVEEYRLIVPHDTALDVNQQVEVGGVTYQIVRLEMALTDRLFRAAILVVRK